MYILGINAFHGDSSACLLKDGLVFCATEEERFRRIKHWAGFPGLSIRFCLDEARISLDDVDFIAVNQSSSANFLPKILFALKNRPNPQFLLNRYLNKKKRKGIDRPEFTSREDL